MKQIVYITEPEAINAELVRELLPANYEIVQGDNAFTNTPVDCSVLIIRSNTIVNKTVISEMPRLAHVVRVGTGVDNIDLEFCNQKDIAVHNAPGANASAVSDYVIAILFTALRKINLLTREDVTSWNRFKFTGNSIASRKIGIVGFGNIGKQIFHKLQNFGCNFYVYDPFIQPNTLPLGVNHTSSIEELLTKSNVVSLHVPLTPNTKYIINKNNIHLLEPGSILINASRGGIVNESGVISYAEQNNLTYIADTVENEPNVSQELIDSKNTIVTPHIASLTHEAEEKTVRAALNNLLNNTAVNDPREKR